MRKDTPHWECSSFSRTFLCICYFVGNKFNILLIKLGQTSLLCKNSLNNLTHLAVKERDETVAHFHNLMKM